MTKEDEATIMTSSKKLLTILTSLILAGCGNLGYIVRTYDSTTVRSDFDYQDETYRIFDRKDLGKVMITPSISSSAGHGFVRGATLGSVNMDDDKTRFTKVATAYLEKDRATQLCNIQKSELLVTPQWEFVYLCKDKPKEASTTGSLQ